MHSEKLKLTVKGQKILHCVKDVSLKTFTYLHSNAHAYQHISFFVDLFYQNEGTLLTFIDSYQTSDIFCLLALNLTEGFLQ